MDFNANDESKLEESEKKFFESKVKSFHSHDDNTPIALKKVEEDGSVQSDIEAAIESTQMPADPQPAIADQAGGAEYLGETEGQGATNDWVCGCGMVFHVSNTPHGPEIAYKNESQQESESKSGNYGKPAGGMTGTGSYGDQGSASYGNSNKPNY